MIRWATHLIMVIAVGAVATGLYILIRYAKDGDDLWKEKKK